MQQIWPETDYSRENVIGDLWYNNCFYQILEKQILRRRNNFYVIKKLWDLSNFEGVDDINWMIYEEYWSFFWSTCKIQD